MNQELHSIDSRRVAVAVRIYRRLLVGYPSEFRHEYGPAMVQLFRDQCRDADRCGKWWGLIGLWAEVLLDLIATSLQEHISTGRKNMIQGIHAVAQFAPRRVFAAVSAAVFLLVAGTSTLITFILQESYSSTARVNVRQEASGANRLSNLPTGDLNHDPAFVRTQFELIQSEVILGKVIDDFDLSRVWGKKYGGNPLSRAEAFALLAARLHLRPLRNTSLLEISVLSDDASEAAMLANAIAQTYQKHEEKRNRTEIVDLAVPGLKPVRPNKPVNIALGVTGAGLLALVAGGALAWLVSWLGRRVAKADVSPSTA